MLKRQRPISPQPSTAEIPVALSDPNSIGAGHFSDHAKRRRVIAPELDGRLRGSASVNDTVVDQEDEIWDADESESQFHSDSRGDSRSCASWREQAGEYKYTNALLHQLHWEHQQRALHSSQPHLPPYCNNSPPLPSNAWLKPSLPCSTSQPLRHSNKDLRLNGPEDDQMHQIPQDDMETHEAKNVKAIYEGNNKLLGSFVLNRLRENRCTSSAGDEDS